jgi:dedicated sortase system histidine kinase
MTLKKQLLLVSLLTLMLPWAGCQFIRETESALRASQQQMLAGAANAIADTLAQYPEEFPLSSASDSLSGNQLYGHALQTSPAIDGYFDDWTIGDNSLAELPGGDGSIRYAVGLRDAFLFLYVSVRDPQLVYANSKLPGPGSARESSDRVILASSNPPYLDETLDFAAEAPGAVVPLLHNEFGYSALPTVRAVWQDVAGGYQLEARIPRAQLGTHLGLIVENVTSANSAVVRNSSYAGTTPGLFVGISTSLDQIANGLVQPGTRMIVTDSAGWRIAMAGNLQTVDGDESPGASRLLRLAYDAMVESGTASVFAEPAPDGREQQPYVASALAGDESGAWFRSSENGRAIVAVAEPVRNGANVIGTVVLQQNTDAILSLTNQGLARLMNVTMLAMLGVAAVLLGYATWLSRRVRRLSVAAERALADDRLGSDLPSATSADEIGDLSRSFSRVLAQLGEYNGYLRTLASKLSHELRTPLAIVTSSLDNLEQEPMNAASAGYTARAKSGAERLRRILGAMSEASRVEELIKDADTESFDLAAIIESTVAAYRDVYAERNVDFTVQDGDYRTHGSPELIIQMLDKLVDNAVSFSGDGDTIDIALGHDAELLRLDVSNPGPPLPENMRSQMFDSMVAVRAESDHEHLGLGLFVARLIADGHEGRITAENTADGARFTVHLPQNKNRH